MDKADYMTQISTVFQKEYEIKYYEQNVKGSLKESALLNFMQDIATLSAESLGFGPGFVFANNYAWVVLKYHIELYNEIKNTSTLRIKTEPRGTSKLYAYRDFEFYTNNSQPSGKAVSTWVLIDMDTRKLLPAQQILAGYMPPYEKREGELVYNKILLPEQIDYKKEFEVRFDDIDVNHHANNSNYIIWALEALDNDFRIKHHPVSIDIKYRKETSSGTKVLSIAQKLTDENKIYTRHIIKDLKNGEELSSSLIQWE